GCRRLWSGWRTAARAGRLTALMGGSLLSEVVMALNASEDRAAGVIPKAKLERWWHSDDAEVLGAVYTLLSEPDAATRIDPPVAFEELSTFLQAYFARCLRHDPKGEWVDSRYSAGWDIVRWFVGWWNDPSVPRTVLGRWKAWLEDRYRSADQAERHAIETATLEHLFESRDVREYFADWRTDPILGPAYERCIEGPAGFLTETTRE
ncbi:MAG: hypothetical protein ACT4O2_08685, partial [Beijerinckiaceae bacterium]